MTCYYQGCTAKGTTTEHVPPKAFFPKDERLQLLTVKACPAHNTGKSQDDLYALAQICMNASPSNRAREVWITSVAPQLKHKQGALRKMIAEGAVQVGKGVAYRVDIGRLDAFFTALSLGLICASKKAQLPTEYVIGHIYHSLTAADGSSDPFAASIESFYYGKPVTVMDFGKADLKNERIYSAEIHGMPDFGGSISIVHLFFGRFKVTSMLSLPRQVPAAM
ncbi:hypothetical protein QP178_03625 [Sphingomonas aurantiaca]|uniref:hypothetical protein n=1 Tax=Sphingomonas aurantiaca TaxID=185949 RepID=UPI002FE1442B